MSSVSVVERGESSPTRKRARSSAPLPRRTPLRFYSQVDDDDDDDDNFIVDDNNDASHGRDHDDDDRQGRNEQRVSEYSPLWDDESWGGSGADDVGQPAAQVEDSDDDRPISVVHRRSTTTPTAPTESPPAPAVAPPEPSSFSDMIRNVTVENPSAFDCSICYLPLKSPIFQCTVGHVVCSPCRDKLGPQATTCHVCRVPIPGSYSRRSVMEQAVDSIRVPCPHAAHGCTARLAYHDDRDAHARTCAHKPCHCPAEGCGFAAPLQTTLLEHFAAVHGWPCSAVTSRGFDVRLRKGLNVVTGTATTGGSATTAEEQYTLVLNVEQAAPACDAITAFCIHPSHTGTVSIWLSYDRRWRQAGSSSLFTKYRQSSEAQLEVVCTDLSNGMPGPGSCFPFLVPRWPPAPGGEEGGEDISVSVGYICRNIWG